MTEKRYLTVLAYAKEFSLHENTVRNMVKKGQLPIQRIGRNIRIIIDPLGEVETAIPAEKRQELTDREAEIRSTEQKLRFLRADKELKLEQGVFCQLEQVPIRLAELDKREAELNARMSPEDLDKWQGQLDAREKKVVKREKEAENLPKRDKDLTRREHLLKAARDKLNKDKAPLERTRAELEAEITRRRQEFYRIERSNSERKEMLLNTALKLVHAKNDRERNDIIAGLLTAFGIPKEAEASDKVKKIMEKTRG